MKTEQDFLMKEIFNNIKNNIIHDNFFPWFLKEKLNENQENSALDSYFTHSFYLNNNINSDKFNLIKPLIEKLKAKALLRVVANFYYRTDKIVEHPMHCDYQFPHKGALLSLNTCDGFTILEDGTRVPSVENQLLHLATDKPHASTSTTNAKGRFNIIVNYF
jgi:hypothetical protein|tara:strand:- start:2867 stop:3352 length:486 start_codon:yes stop_codon:yes gene_type:complete